MIDELSKEVDVNREGIIRSEGWRMRYLRSQVKKFLKEDKVILWVKCF